MKFFHRSFYKCVERISRIFDYCFLEYLLKFIDKYDILTGQQINKSRGTALFSFHRKTLRQENALFVYFVTQEGHLTTSITTKLYSYGIFSGRTITLYNVFFEIKSNCVDINISDLKGSF